MDKLKNEMFEALSYLFEHAHSCTDCEDAGADCYTCERDNTRECDIAYYKLSSLIESISQKKNSKQ